MVTNASRVCAHKRLPILTRGHAPNHRGYIQSNVKESVVEISVAHGCNPAWSEPARLEEHRSGAMRRCLVTFVYK